MRRMTNCWLVCVGFLLLTVNVHAEVHQSDIIPWSGYWWPFTHGELINGYSSESGYASSPIRKYDTVVSGTNNGPASQQGISLYYNEDSVDWAGMCLAWAVASINEPAPENRGVYNDLIFNVGDKKGLLTSLYDGVRFSSFRSFHKPVDFLITLEEYIKDRKLPLVVDLGGVGANYNEIWNYPVYKYDLSQSRFGDAIHYTVVLYFADDMVHPDFVGTRELSRTYTFRFDLDGDVVVGSEWTGNSVNNSPKYCSIFFGEPKPRNTGLTPSIVQAIARTNDDRFSGNSDAASAVGLDNGDFTLLSITDDYFSAELKQGDLFSLTLTGEWHTDFSLRVYDPEDQLAATLDGNGTLLYQPLLDGVYTIVVTRSDSIFQAAYWLRSRLELPHSLVLPGYLGGSWNNQLVVASPDRGMGDRIILSLSDKTGKVYASRSTETEGKALKGDLSEDPYRIEGSLENSMLRIHSDRELHAILSVFNTSETIMRVATGSTQQRSSRQVYFPHMPNTSKWSTSARLYNASSVTETVGITTYDALGKRVGFVTVELGPEEHRNVSPASLGIGSLRIVAMSAAASSGNPVLIGSYTYEYKASLFTTDSGAQLWASPIEEATDDLFFPHVHMDSSWVTGIAVMNLGPVSDILKIEAFDSAGLLLEAVEFPILPRQVIAKAASDFFSAFAPERLSSMTMTALSGNPIAGLAAYMTPDLEHIVAVNAGSAAKASRHLLFPLPGEDGDLFTGIGVMNGGRMTDLLLFSLFDQSGKRVDRSSLRLSPKQKTAFGIGDMFPGLLFDPGFQGYITVDSTTLGTGSLSGMFIRGLDKAADGGTIQ